jgi:hypothetical protein
LRFQQSRNKHQKKIRSQHKEKTTRQSVEHIRTLTASDNSLN